MEPTETVLKRYNLINKAHWEALERKELTREQVLVGRFQVLFEEMGITVEPVKVARTYEHNLGIGHWFMPGAEEAVERLSKKYKLYLASNGTAKVQAGRLKSANISRFLRRKVQARTKQSVCFTLCSILKIKKIKLRNLSLLKTIVCTSTVSRVVL